MRKRIWNVLAVVLAAGIFAAGCGKQEVKTETKAVTTEAAKETTAAAGAETEKAESKAGGAQVAGAGETVSQEQVVTEDMVPVYGEAVKDGVYTVTVDSSSSMFKIVDCELTVADGSMTAVMTMSGQGYLKLYMGTGEEALNAPEDQMIPFVENAEGAHTYTVPVEALDMGIDCAAFSKSKEKWYDRVLVFRADSLPTEAFAAGMIKTAKDLGLEDGHYTAEVALEGGSGRAKVESPAAIRIEDGKIYATIAWGSSNYDYMRVGDEKFEPLSPEGNSVFEIPVEGFDWKLPAAANTTAMSTPHEIDYTLTFDSSTVKKAE